jgi:hypothetical protein
MNAKWLAIAAVLACAGSAEAQGLVGYVGPPGRVYDRPAPVCGPECVINTLADAVIRVAPLFIKPRCCAQTPPPYAAPPPATNGSAPAPAPPNQPDALEELPTKPLVPGGITRGEIQAALVDWCQSGHENAPLCVKLKKRPGEK